MPADTHINAVAAASLPRRSLSVLSVLAVSIYPFSVQSMRLTRKALAPGKGPSRLHIIHFPTTKLDLHY